MKKKSDMAQDQRPFETAVPAAPAYHIPAHNGVSRRTAQKPSHPSKPTYLSKRRVLFLGAVASLSFLAFFVQRQDGNAYFVEREKGDSWGFLASSLPATDPGNLIDLDQMALLETKPYLPILSDNEMIGRDEVPYQEKETTVLKVQKGDTLLKLLQNAGIDSREAYAAIEALRPVYSPRNIKPGQEIQVAFLIETNPESEAAQMFNRQLASLSIRATVEQDVKLVRSQEAGFEVKETLRPLEKRTLFGQGRIVSSLFEAGHAAQIPTSVLTNLISIYSFDVDFQRDIQKGDGFEVYYEAFYDADGKLVKTGEVLYSNLVLSGTEHPLYAYTPKSGISDYFNLEGKSVRKLLMRTPIDGARLSSGFGMRKHPVLNYSKMHKGVDFAAPTGTPIYAAGNGVIEKAAPFSSYGNYIRIRHSNGYKTAYAHLHGFAKGIKAGTRVKQGDVIGYVGSTGRSTGPHLHYEVIVDGKHVNPNSLKLPSGENLAGEELVAFQTMIGEIKTSIAALDTTKSEQLAEKGR